MRHGGARAERRGQHRRLDHLFAGCASAFGPLLIAHMRQRDGSYTTGLRTIAVIMALSLVVPILVRPPSVSVVKSALKV